MVTAERPLKGAGRFWRVEKTFRKGDLIGEGKVNHMRSLDAPFRRLLCGAYDEVCYGTPLQFSRPFQKGLQIWRDASFKSRGL